MYLKIHSLFQLLLNHGANPTAEDKDGFKPEELKDNSSVEHIRQWIRRHKIGVWCFIFIAAALAITLGLLAATGQFNKPIAGKNSFPIFTHYINSWVFKERCGIIYQKAIKQNPKGPVYFSV